MASGAGPSESRTPGPRRPGARPPAKGSRRTRSNGARASRAPAVTVLLLLVLVVAGVSVAFALQSPPSEGRSTDVTALGTGVTLLSGSEEGEHSPVEAAALTGPLPADAGEEDYPQVETDALAESLPADAGEGGYSPVEAAALAGPLPADAKDVYAPVLMYHYVDDEPPPAGPYADGLTVRTPDFVEELEYLAANGFETIGLDDAYLAMAGLRELPAKPVILTFDDGGLDNYTVAFPLLTEYGFKGTFFVITKTVGREGQMDWDQLREMVAAGMAVQSHTVSHPDLTGVSAERLQAELSDSRTAISEATGEVGYALCYPAGSYDDTVIAAARAAGYVVAVATDSGAPLGPDSLFTIKRKRVQPFLPISTFARLVE